MEDVFVAERAAEWLHCLPTASDQQRREFIRWLKESPKHVREMLLAMSWDELLHSVDPGRKIDVDSLAEEAAGNVIRLESRRVDEGQEAPPRDLLHRGIAQDPNVATVAAQARRSSRRQKSSHWTVLGWLIPSSWAAVAAASTVATVAILFAVVLKGGWSNPIVSTRSGEWQKQTLSDGTTVDLGPLTVISLRFSEGQRLVHLSKGDALFDVVKDPARPFIVETDRASVRAVGTMFGVTQAADRTVVTVSAGVVVVSDLRRSEQLGDDATVVVKAGEQVVIDDVEDARRPLAAAKKVNVKNELAWVNRNIVLDGVPAGVAIKEFNRRNDVQIKLSDSKLANRRVYGEFRIDRPEGFEGFLRKLRE